MRVNLGADGVVPYVGATIVGSAALGGLAVVAPPLVTVAAIGFVLLVVAAIVVAGNPATLRRLSYLAIGLMFVDLSPITVGGSAVRLYQPITLVLIGALLLPGKGRPLKRGPLLGWLILFTALVAASYAWTISPSDTLAVAVGQSYLVYLVVLLGGLLGRGVITVPGMLTALWAGAVASSTVAMLQFMGGLAGSAWGLQYVVGVPWGRPQGLMREPDWTALAAAVGLVIAVTLRRGARWYRTSMLLFVATLGVTVVRAVILAVAVMFLLSVLQRHQHGLRQQLWWLVPVGGTATLLVSVYWPDALSRLHLSSLLPGSGGDGGSLDSRLGVVSLIQDRGPDTPWLGHGAGSLAYESALPENAMLYAGGGELNAGRGSTNLFLTSFWDLGWIGVVVMAGVVLAWLLCAWRVRAQYPALLALAVLLLVDFQANNGLRFGFVWALMAATAWAAANRSVLDAGVVGRVGLRDGDGAVHEVGVAERSAREVVAVPGD